VSKYPNNIITHGGAKIGNDAVQQEPSQHQWVKNNFEPRKQFDVQNEKEIFKQDRQEFLISNGMKLKNNSSDILNSSQRRHICERLKKKSIFLSKKQMLMKYKREAKPKLT
jgi:hypothetical protein